MSDHNYYKWSRNCQRMSYVYQGRVDCFLCNIVNFKTVVYLGKIGTEHTVGYTVLMTILCCWFHGVDPSIGAIS